MFDLLPGPHGTLQRSVPTPPPFVFMLDWQDWM
jgi:hypothetical protein